MTAGTRPLAAPPPSWLVLKASAVLQAVATANYACYGRQGVPRYPRDAPRPPRDRATLCTEVMLRDAAGEVRLAFLDLDLDALEQSAQQIVWAGYDEVRHAQVVWVWDFYRILSHVLLRVKLPSGAAASEAAWCEAVEALRAARAGDTIECHVRSACGDIHQPHPIEQPATEWHPDPS